MSDPFFGDWVPRNKKNNMSQGALDFIHGKYLNGQNTNANKTHDELIQEFEEQKEALKEMEKNMSPEDRKLMAQAMGQGGNSGSSVADRFRSAMKNINKK